MRYIILVMLLGIAFFDGSVAHAATVDVSPTIFTSCEANEEVSVDITGLDEGYLFINFAPDPVEADRIWYGAFYEDGGTIGDIATVFQYGDCEQLPNGLFGDWIFAVISSTTQEGACGMTGLYSDCEADILEEYTVTITEGSDPLIECMSGNPIPDAVCEARNEIADDAITSVANNLDRIMILFGGLTGIGLTRRLWVKFIGKAV